MLASASANYNAIDWILAFIVGGGGLSVMGTMIKVGSTMGRVNSTIDSIERRVERLENINDNRKGANL